MMLYWRASAASLLLLCLVVVVVESVTYDRCQLARDLRDRFKFPASDISQCELPDFNNSTYCPLLFN